MRYPEYPLSACAGGFYLYQLEHLPWPFWLLFSWVGIGFTWVMVFAARRWLTRRLAQPAVRLGPELLISGALIIAISGTDFFQESWFVIILPGAFWLWLVWVSWSRQVGVFYTGFIGLLLFVLAVSAYRVLFVQEWLYGYGSYYLQRQAAVAELERRYRWEAGEERRILYRSNEAVLSVPILPGVWFHDSRLISFIYGVPEPGIGICYLSASEQDPFAVPAVAIFQTEQLKQAVGSDLFETVSGSTGPALELSPQAESYLRESVERAVILRRKNGEIESFEYRGKTRLPPYLQLEELGDAPGIYYTYRDRLLEEEARLILYITPDARFIIVVNDAPDSQMLFEPATLAILRGIRIPESNPQ